MRPVSGHMDFSIIMMYTFYACVSDYKMSLAVVTILDDHLLS